MQFVTVVAYYYRFTAPESDRKNVIASEDLQTAARHARGFGFKTPSKTLNNAVQQGYLDSAGNGTYRINAVGENLVAMTLPGSGALSAGSQKAKRRWACPNRVFETRADPFEP